MSKYSSTVTSVTSNRGSTSAISHEDILKQMDYLFPKYTSNSSISDVDNTININSVILSDIAELKGKIANINEMLLILQRDTTMESKYPELAEAYRNYNRLLKMLIAEEILKDER